MSKKRLLSIVISAVILLSFACTAMAAEKSERYVGDSTVNGSIYQTYYQVDAQTRTGVKKISVSGVLYEKGNNWNMNQKSKLAARTAARPQPAW